MTLLLVLAYRNLDSDTLLSSPPFYQHFYGPKHQESNAVFLPQPDHEVPHLSS
jgi:hypothetical protein